MRELIFTFEKINSFQAFRFPKYSSESLGFKVKIKKHIGCMICNTVTASVRRSFLKNTFCKRLAPRT